MRLSSLSLAFLFLLLSGLMVPVLVAEDQTAPSFAQRILSDQNPVETTAHQTVTEPDVVEQRLRLVSEEVELITPGQAIENPETLRREQLTQQYLHRLRKPMEQINISAGDPEQPTPDNRAERLMATKPPVEISGGLTGTILPDRYPITMCHQPLYFEQPNLERCGHACGYLQNAVSAAQFLTHTVVLPYQICRHRDRPCVSAGGDCQTCQQIRGCPLESCLPLDPKALDPKALDPKALATEAASIAGFSFLLL